MKSLYAAVAAAGLAFTASASAQVRMLQMDINSLGFQAQNAAGAPGAFSGLNHTGALVLQDQVPPSVLNDIAVQTGGTGPFLPQAFSGGLTDFLMTINLNNGTVTGGSLMVHVGSSMYSANILPGGMVTNYVGGGFKVEALTGGGAFNSATFAGVNVADFFAAQGGAGLPGSFINFRIEPSVAGAGFSDVDLFVSNIPAPGSLALLGLGGLIATRRRR
jgi:hypothetical protein